MGKRSKESLKPGDFSNFTKQNGDKRRKIRKLKAVSLQTKDLKKTKENEHHTLSVVPIMAPMV